MIKNLLSKEAQRDLLLCFEGNSVYLISFPRIKRDDVLSYSLFGHELGHPIAKRILEEEQENITYKEYQKGINKHIEELIKQKCISIKNVELFEEKRAWLKEILEMRNRAMTELISDAVAVHLFGPSVLYALHELFAGEALDASPEYPEYYPPPRYRLRQVHTLLESEGYYDALDGMEEPIKISGAKESLQKFKEYLIGLLHKTSDIDNLKTEFIQQTAYQWVEASLSEALEKVKLLVNRAKYQPSQIMKEVPWLVDRLALGIPPNEIGRYPDTHIADWRAAILASWVYKIRGVSLPYEKEIELLDDKCMMRLQNLTLRAIDFIMLAKNYEEYKSR